MPVSLKRIYKKRPAWSHKGQYGRLLVVGGSVEYSGSPVFNALAAYRSGCDLVRIAAPEKAARIAKSYKPDMIATPLEGDYLSPRHVKKILELQASSHAMVIGGGLGRNKGVFTAVRAILRKTKIPAVVDADALHAINSRLGRSFVVTPHTYEFYVLSGRKLLQDVREREEATRKLAEKLGCTVLLKGHVDVISDGKRTNTNSTGSPFMTKGGFGDTLAGICGALLARGLAPYDAACAAAYINGAAGRLASKRRGEGVMASDLIDEIPDVLKN